MNDCWRDGGLAVRLTGIEADAPPCENAMNELSKIDPERKHPAHPPAVERCNRPVIIFLTVCSHQRRRIFDDNRVYQVLLKSWSIAEQWHVGNFVIMPDHIHLIATFDLTTGIKASVSAWKRYQTKILGIAWQADFFEHRLRNQSEFDEKAYYIRMNPVRKNMVRTAEEWPYVVDWTTIRDGSFGELALPKMPNRLAGEL